MVRRARRVLAVIDPKNRGNPKVGAFMDPLTWVRAEPSIGPKRR